MEDRKRDDEDFFGVYHPCPDEALRTLEKGLSR